MASSNNVFVNAGWVEDGFFELVTVPPVVPALITLGSPGAALHSLPMRTLGGSVADLDLLYGVLGHEATLDDIQPFFVLGSREGLLRYFGYEIPRQAIQDTVTECYATLLSVEDISIEGNPASGNNLFGFVGLTTRPLSTVTISNVDGAWSELVLRELLLNSPAALYVDIAHTLVMPVLRGTVADYTSDGTEIVITYGFQARRKRAPALTD